MRSEPLIRIFIAAVLSLTVTTGCSYLEEDPKSQITEEESLLTSKDVYVNTVLSLYNHMGGTANASGLQGTYYGVYDYNTFTSDEAIIPTRGGEWYDGSYWMDLTAHTWAPSDKYILSMWNYLFKAILMCNRSIEILQESSVVSEEDRTKWSAEVYTLRALFYWYLLDLFGNVPLVYEWDDNAIENVAPSTRTEVLDYVYLDLMSSIGDLEDCLPTYFDGMYGRVTKPVAMFIMAKIALNAEVYDDTDWTDGKSVDGSQVTFEIEDGTVLNAWETCLHYCNALAAYCELEDQYAETFSEDNCFSSEVIFQIPVEAGVYNSKNTNLNRSLHPYHGQAVSLQGGNASSATLDALSVHGYGSSSPDPRLGMNYFYGEVSDKTGNPVNDAYGQRLSYEPTAIRMETTGGKYEKTAGARMRKYYMNAVGTGNGMNTDIVLFRYADVLLMKAEALLRLGRTSEAQEAFDEVRSRVFENYGPSHPMYLKVNYFTLLDERLRELSWEGWRRQDLIRFGQFTRPWAEREPLDGESSGDAGASTMELWQNAVDPLDGEIDMSGTLSDVPVHDTSYDPLTGTGTYGNTYRRKYGRPQTGYTIVFPIPSSVLSYNKNFSQNPGY